MAHLFDPGAGGGAGGGGWSLEQADVAQAVQSLLSVLSTSFPVAQVGRGGLRQSELWWGGVGWWRGRAGPGGPLPRLGRRAGIAVRVHASRAGEAAHSGSGRCCAAHAVRGAGQRECKGHRPRIWPELLLACWRAGGPARYRNPSLPACPLPVPAADPAQGLCFPAAPLCCHCCLRGAGRRRQLARPPAGLAAGAPTAGELPCRGHRGRLLHGVPHLSGGRSAALGRALEGARGAGVELAGRQRRWNAGGQTGLLSRAVMGGENNGGRAGGLLCRACTGRACAETQLRLGESARFVAAAAQIPVVAVRMESTTAFCYLFSHLIFAVRQ